KRVGFGIRPVRAEIVTDPVAQRPRFTDINRVALPVEVQIHARLLRQPGDLLLEFVDGHTLLCRVSYLGLNPPLYVTRFHYLRRQGRAPGAAAIRVRRILGFDARPLLGSGAPDRADLPLLEARPQRLRHGRRAHADLLDHDQLRARARRIARQEVQGRLHGAART